MPGPPRSSRSRADGARARGGRPAARGSRRACSLPSRRREVLRWTAHRRARDRRAPDGAAAATGRSRSCSTCTAGRSATSTTGSPARSTRCCSPRGFAILEPNPRGSTGRGQDFASAGRRRHGRSRRRRRARRRRRGRVAPGIADPDRLVLTGGSYGGFMAAWIPTRDRRFKASVAISPVTDWWSERFDSSLGAWVGDFLGGEPHEVPGGVLGPQPRAACGDASRRRCCSPSGRHDRATPVGQAVEFYRALRERGVPSRGRRVPAGRARRRASSRRSSISRRAWWPGSSGSCRRRRRRQAATERRLATP